MPVVADSISHNVASVFRFGRIQENADYLLPILAGVLLVWYFWRRLHLDTDDLKRWQRIVLLTLRCIAVAGLFVYYLQPQWLHLVGSSNVAVLVDSSASMAATDVQKDVSRIASVCDFLNGSHFIETLAQRHAVKELAFDSAIRPLKTDASGNRVSVCDGETTAVADAISDVFAKERGEPLAAVIMFSDGQQNAGQSIETALATAVNLRIPIYTVGLGQTELPPGVRFGNIDVPDRVFPGDAFRLTVPIQCENVAVQQIPVLLLDGETKIGEQVFVPEKQQNAVFDVKLENTGKHKLTLRIAAAGGDAVPVDANVEVNVVDRKDKILLFASAPSRDYQFLCSQIYRDKTMTADVLASWQQNGEISQNVDKILTSFPATKTEMANYDILIVFDPDWRELSPQQIDVLEHWISRQGGGVILIAGGILQADSVSGWLYNKDFEKIRALYPVEFFALEAAFDSKMNTGIKPQAVQLTPQGEEAAYLQPYSDAVQSRSFWNTFPGFYSCFSSKGVKPAATLLAASGSSVWMAEQFYGSGRVLYLGSGELWRLRKYGENVFEQITTKMIRYIGQGRLQRDSDRGSITTDKRQYSLNASAQLRITANDAQLSPLTVPKLPVEVQTPSGAKRLVEAVLDPNVPGVYQTFIPLISEGTWTFRLHLDAPGNETAPVVEHPVQVRISDLEREHSNRNEALLQRLATDSGGAYFASFDDLATLPDKIKIRSQKAVLDTSSEERLYYSLLSVICAVLSLEWLLRRFWTLV